MLMYLKPLSTASVTITASGPSRSASRCAPTRFAPVEIPARIPSSCASRNVIATASSSSIGSTWSTLEASQCGITRPVQPWIANGPSSPPPMAGGLVGLDDDTAWLQRVRDAHHRARSPEAVTEGRHLPASLLPDLAPQMVAVMRNGIGIVELVGRIVARQRRELRGALDHVADVLRRHLRTALDRLHDVEIGTEGSHQLEALLGEAVRHHDHAPVALRATDERERGPRAAARVLDDRVTFLQQAVALGPLDHRHRHPVLHRAARVAVLELQPQLRAVLRRAACQADERRVADRVEDRHAASRTGSGLTTTVSATSKISVAGMSERNACSRIFSGLDAS